MNLKQIKQEQKKINEEISKLQEKLEILDDKKQEVKNKDFFKLVKGTNWYIPQNYIGLSLNEIDKHPLEKYICDDLGLYPHGSTSVGYGISISCSDSNICLTVKLSSDEYSTKLTADEYYNMQYKKLFEFVKENSIIVDFSRREKEIQHHKNEVTRLEKELAFIKSL